MTSNLSAFAYIPERAQATPALWNDIFSVLSSNIAAVGSSASLSSPSGNTVSISTNLEVIGGGHFQFLSVGSTPPSYVTTAAVTIEVNSAFSDYLYMVDSSAQKSSYIIGSRAGGTADGLNIWDVSAGTMIASFSKQSIRFFQNVVGPVFDVGGALASTINAGTFGTATDSNESRIQAAISAATTTGLARVYVPASMYPYRSGLVSFATTVQMVREGGNWSVYDAFAYGARGLGHDAAALQAAGDGAAANDGIAYFPPGSYQVGASLTFNAVNDVQFVGGGGNATLLVMAASGITLLNFTGTCSRVGIVGLWLGSFVSRAAGGGLSIIGATGSHSDTFRVADVTVQNIPQPVTLQLLDQSVIRTLRVVQSVAGAVKTAAVSLRTVISSEIDDLQAFASAGSFPSDVVQIDHDCDSLFINNSQALYGTGTGFRFMQTAGSTGPRLTRVTNCLAELNTNAGFAIESCRDIRLAGCEASLNGGIGYNVSGGSSVALINSLAYQNNNHGFDITGDTQGAIVDSCTATNNSQSAHNTFDGIRIESGVTGAIVSNNRSGEVILVLANKQRYGLSLGASTDSLVVIGNDLRGNATDGLGNFSAGSNNVVVDPSNTTMSATGDWSLAGGLRVPSGSALVPSLAFKSEVSLGFYRSTTSTAVLSYGTFAASLYSSINPGSFAVEFRVGNNNRLATGVAGSGYFLDVGTLLIRDGDSGTAGRIRVASDGAASNAAFGFNNETALGWYRSGLSTMGLTRGALALPDGSSTTPSLGYSSNSSLGFYSSGVQTIAQSYGTFDLTLAIASLGTIRVKSGANNSCGTAVLGSNGSVNVANTYVKTGDLIFLTDQSPGGTLGDLEVGGIRNSSGFTIQSTSVTDTSTVGWLIIRPG